MAPGQGLWYPLAMDTTMVRVNGVCNASCAFCELSGKQALDGADLERIQSSLEADRAAGASRLRVSGGEPLLEPGLWSILEYAQSLGFEEIILETNGTLVDGEDLAQRLRAAGVTRALWALYAPDASISDAVYGLEGAHAASVEGARALMNAGIQVVARTPLSVPLLHTLDQIPPWIATNLPEVAAWWLRPLIRSERSRFDVGLLPPLPALSRAIRAAHFAAREQGLSVEIEDDLGLPLCLFSGDNQSLRSLQRHPTRSRLGTHTKADDCLRCVAAGECPGQPRVYAGVHGPWEVSPYERIPQALVARSSRPETYVIYDRTQQEGDELTGAQVTIRVLMPCNQDCTFCFVDRTSPGLGDDEIFAAIDEAADRGASRVSFSGGEPTLHRRLPEFVRRATERGLHEREIQTNALRLTDASLCDELVGAGLTQAVVSLHAVDPERYLAITGAGRPDQVIEGVRNLLNRGVRVELNLVHNRDNLDHLSEVVEEVAERIPEVRLLFSVTYIVDGLPRQWDKVAVRYTDAVPHLVAAMAVARREGVRHRLTGRCGTPPCAWRDHLDTFFSFDLVETGGDEPERGHSYVEACEGCAARPYCYGLNDAYMRRFGADELQTLTQEQWDAARALAHG